MNKTNTAKREASTMKRRIAAVAAALQIGIGILLLVGTAGLAGTAYRTVREESGQLAANLVAAADALESARGTYAQSATNLFVLTGTMDKVGGTLVDVSEKVSDTGMLFKEYAETFLKYSNPTNLSESENVLLKTYSKVPEWLVDKVPGVKTVKSLAALCKNSGEKIESIGESVHSVATALQGQGKAIDEYRDDGHEKSLAVMAETAESLRHAEAILNSNSAERWCGFVCLLGFCVSMLFFANGALMLALAREEGKAA